MDSGLWRVDGLALYAGQANVIDRMTPSAAAAMGLSPGAALGQPFEQFLPKRQAQVAAEAHAARASHYPLHIGGRSYDVHLQWHGAEVTGTLVDTTDLIRTQEALVRARSVQRDMITFLTTAAHDVANPVANVTLLADELRDGFQDLGDGKLQMIDLLEQVAAEAMELIGSALKAGSDMSDDPAAQQLDVAVRDALLVLDPHLHWSVEAKPVCVMTDASVFQLTVHDALSCVASPDHYPVDVDVTDRSDGWLRLQMTTRQAATEVQAGMASTGAPLQHLVQSVGGTVHVDAHDAGARLTCAIPGHLVLPDQVQRSA